ncbi:Rab proteins geranylgeranyltransferase component A [Physocladia obscura]|uniref:Rab proteins geranylgeranyltransferase component A n=1 Tax=Physocladia obscura TaxID=109957 RepID=A0AAD5T1U5_9FUNG|nr:Rab proteins geranylgeranyltransferase component A [Physocladia obscura]
MASEDVYDVLIVGTGAAESILAAAFARIGQRVVHVDANTAYGDVGTALDAFQLREYLAEQHESTVLESDSTAFDKSDARKCCFELLPKLIFASSPLITTMINCNVASYLEFRALESLHLFWNGAFDAVPGSKEDIFKNDSISLVEKRRLMKLLSNILDSRPATADSNSEDGNLPTEVAQPAESAVLDEEADDLFVDVVKKVGLSEKSRATLFHAIGMFLNAEDAENDTLVFSRKVTKRQALAAIKQYLTSIGRFSASAFLSGVYGTASEISQAFCRVCAVNGGTYMLGFTPIETSIINKGESGDPIFRVSAKVEGLDDVTNFSCKWIVVSSSSAHRFKSVFSKIAGNRLGSRLDKRISRCICVLDSKIPGIGEPGVIVIPPATHNNTNGILAIQHSKNTLVCPSGKYILYLSSISTTATTAEQDLSASLEALLTVKNQFENEEQKSANVLFTAYYTQEVYGSESDSPRFIITKDDSETIGFEGSLAEAESLFTRIAEGLGVADAKFLAPNDTVVDDDE